MSSDVHVIPLNDLREHDDSQWCWCMPKVEIQDDGRAVVIHNSADGRELVERHGVN